MQELSALPTPLNSEEPAVSKLLIKHLGQEWQQKCERTLYLAKNLGNIYTGSLYNGLLSLLSQGMPVGEGGDGLDLAGKKIMMFSYGSGCAASMFLIRVQNDWTQVIRPSMFKKRLESRIKISPEEYAKWMDIREHNYGKVPYTPSVSH